jgi:hypothetical protein
MHESAAEWRGRKERLDRGTCAAEAVDGVGGLHWWPYAYLGRVKNHYIQHCSVLFGTVI